MGRPARVSELEVDTDYLRGDRIARCRDSFSQIDDLVVNSCDVMTDLSLALDRCCKTWWCLWDHLLTTTYITK